MQYENPVQRGFFPDPSVIRFGTDYYMVNSSFQYFPCIPVSHSKDMVHWEIISHAIENPDYLDLCDINDSHGIWASDISYYNGRFYIFATLRLNGDANAPVTPLNHPPFRRQLVVSADSPYGPWSRPCFIDVDDIDPSHFVDETVLSDGTKSVKHYMLIAPGVRAVELSDDLTKAVGEPKLVWKGTGLRCPEGPHIWKHTLNNGDTWYYAILAEGGTGYGHRMSVARSKTLFGHYEESPYNPVMTQPDSEALLQRCGHGKPVQALDGSWWMYYLCARPVRDENGNAYTVLGRETALDPIEFTSDGWFTVNKGRGPGVKQFLPDDSGIVSVQNCTDKKNEQDGSKKNQADNSENVQTGKNNNPYNLKNFQFVRNPDKSHFTFCASPFYYTIVLQQGKLFEKAAKNTLLMRETSHHMEVSVHLDFIPVTKGDEAGLTSYYSTTTYVSLSIRLDEKNCRVLVLAKNSGEGETIILQSKPIKNGTVVLKMQKEKLLRKFSACYADNPKEVLFSAALETPFLSDEGNKQERKRHTGTLSGMYANTTESASSTKAVFSKFEMTEMLD